MACDRLKRLDIHTPPVQKSTMLASNANDNALEQSLVWADFGSGDSVFSGAEVSHTVDCNKKSLKKKSSRSESSAKKKKKKKSKKRDLIDDNDNGDGSELYSSTALFAKAKAKAQAEEAQAGEEAALSEAFRDMHSDQEFATAFESSSFTDVYPFADFDEGMMIQEQAAVMPNKPVREESGASDGGWIIDNNSKGAKMLEYSRRRSDLASTVSRDDRATGRSKSSKTPSGSTEETEPVRHRNHYYTHDTPVSTTIKKQQNSGAIDISNYEVDFNDNTTISSELTGLTGIFPNRPSNNEDEHDDDDDSWTDEEYEYHRLNSEMSKFIMMQNQPKKKKPKHKVKFGSVTVRDFERILGDNPSCKYGAPLAIGWKVESVEVHPSPEAHDLARIHPKRDSLVVSRDDRHLLLLKLGYSQREIAQAVRNVVKDRQKRRTTVNNLGIQQAQETMENVTSGLKRMFLFKKS